MRLFMRTVRMTGPPAESLGFCTDMRAHVSDKIGIEVGLWSVAFGAPLGTVVYSARLDGLAQLEEITATLMADEQYHALLARGAALSAGDAEDTLAVPLNDVDGELPPVGSVVTGTTAIIAGGKYAEAVTWGTDIAEYTANVSGYPVGFYMGAFGTFGNVAWLSGAPDAASAEAANDKVDADPGYLDRLGKVGDLFVEGSGNRTMATRIA